MLGLLTLPTGEQVPIKSNGEITTAGDVKRWLSKVPDDRPVKVTVIEPVEEKYCSGLLNGLGGTLPDDNVVDLAVYICGPEHAYLTPNTGNAFREPAN